MKRILFISAMAALLLLLPTSRASAQYFNHLALGITAGVDGFGLELAAPIGNQIQIRLGGSMFPPMWKPHHVFTFEETADHTQKSVDIEAFPMFGGANLMLDWHPAGNKWFFITAGMYAGTKQVLTVRNKEPFLDEEDWGTAGLMVGDVMITTDDKGIVEGSLHFWPVRPYAGIGFGNAINPNKRVCFNVELGAAYTGGYKVMVTGENTATFEKGTIQIHSSDFWTGSGNYADADAAARADKNNYEDKLILDKMAKFPVLPMLKFGLYIRLF